MVILLTAYKAASRQKPVQQPRVMTSMWDVDVWSFCPEIEEKLRQSLVTQSILDEFLKIYDDSMTI